MNNSEATYTAPAAQPDTTAKGKKRKKKIVIAAIVIAAVAVLVLPACFLLLILSSVLAKPEVVTDVGQYSTVINTQEANEYKDKWGMSEDIFPASVNEKQVKDFVSVHYNPWDSQYLAKLTVKYQREQYDAEMQRLGAIGIDSYEGIYGAKGFGKGYKLAAMNSDEYQGMVYALSDGKDTITYVEMIFCNYYMDLDYTKYIEKEFLPLGFDATKDNPYEKEMMKHTAD